MDSVVIVADEYVGNQLFQSIVRLPSIEFATNGRIVLHERGGRVYFGRDDHVGNEFEAAQLDAIRNHVEEPAFYVIEFSDIQACRRLLLAVANRPDILIDNDHGLLTTGTLFIQQIQARPDWDWRRDV